MNGKKARRLRKQLAEVLKRAPEPAKGHVRYVAERFEVPDKDNRNKQHPMIHWKEFVCEGNPDNNEFRVFKRAVKRGEIEV